VSELAVFRSPVVVKKVPRCRSTPKASDCAQGATASARTIMTAFSAENDFEWRALAEGHE